MRLVFSIIFAGIAFCLCILALLLSSTRIESNAKSASETLACLQDGSCVGGSPTFETLVVDTPVISENIYWNAFLTTLNSIITGPHVVLASEPGSNVLVTPTTAGTTVSLSQAIVVTSLASQHTLFGTNTSCVQPIQSNCYNLSGQTCNQGALLISCIPQVMEFNTLHVQGTLFLINSSVTESINNDTDLNTTYSIVNTELILTDTMTCTGGSFIEAECLHLGNHVCATGPLDPNCVLDSLPFYDVTVNNTLHLDGLLVCLGPIMDAGCTTGVETNGDTMGSWTGQQTVVAIQNDPLDTTGLTPAAAALIWNGTAWIDKPVNATDAQPSSLMARDANGNSSATTVFSEASLIQGPAGGSECVGLGRPKPATQRFYFTAAASTVATNSYFVDPNTLVYYDAVTNKNTFVGEFSGSLTHADAFGLFFHPNGTLYLSPVDGSIHRLLDLDAAVTVLTCSGLGAGAYAYDANSTLYVLLRNGTFMTVDLDACELTLVKTLDPLPVPSVFQGVIIGSTFYIHLSTNLWTFDIGSSTSNVPTLTPMPAGLGHTLSSAGEVYSECIGGVRVPAAFAQGPAGGFNTSAFDPITYTPITSQFKFTNVNNPGVVWSAGKTTAEAIYWYSWSGVANNCYEPTQESGTSCLPHGDLDMEDLSIYNIHGLATTDIFPSTPNATEVTINDVGLQMGRYSIQFLDNTTRVSQSGVGAALLINEGSGTLLVNNQVEAKRFYSPLGSISLVAGVGAGTTAPSVLTVTNARACRWIVSVTTGASPVASSVIFDVVISGQTSFAPGVVFSPVNQNSAQLAGNQRPFITNEAMGGFSFMSNVVGLSASTNYQWTFQSCI